MWKNPVNAIRMNAAIHATFWHLDSRVSNQYWLLNYCLYLYMSCNYSTLFLKVNESSRMDTLRSYLTISQMMTEGTILLLPSSGKSYASFRSACLQFTLTILIVKVKVINISTVNVSESRNHKWWGISHTVKLPSNRNLYILFRLTKLADVDFHFAGQT